MRLTNCGLIALAAFNLTFSRSYAQSVTVLDTVYTPNGYEDGPLTGTVYIPTVSNGVGVVLAHYYTGNRQTLDTWCDTLSAHGYTAMTIDYYDWSSSTYGVYPKPVRAFKIAVEFLRRNAVRFRIATGKVVGFGKSEGAFHWGETIIWDNDDGYFQTDSTINDHLDAMVLLYGLYDNNNYLQSSIPMNTLLTGFFAPNPALRSTKGNCIVNVRNITTPVLMFHGTNDNVIQYQQSVQLHDSLVAHGTPSELVSNSSWDHGFDNVFSPPYSFTPEGLVAKDTVLAFLQRTVRLTSVPFTTGNLMPADFHLSQNYPNPFNPTTTINYDLPEPSNVSLIIYDVLGREVADLVNGSKEAGYHSAIWNAKDAASGVYFARFIATYANGNVKLNKVSKLLLAK